MSAKNHAAQTPCVLYVYNANISPMMLASFPSRPIRLICDIIFPRSMQASLILPSSLFSLLSFPWLLLAPLKPHWASAELSSSSVPA